MQNYPILLTATEDYVPFTRCSYYKHYPKYESINGGGGAKQALPLPYFK